MENCEHETHHDDCCVCWHKQSIGQSYPNDIPLFMHKMAALLMNKDWRSYCLDKALRVAKNAFETKRDYLLKDYKLKEKLKDASMIDRLRKSQKGWAI